MPPSPVTEWLDAFHAGRSDVLEACYREHFDSVTAAVGRVLRPADRDTIVHHVFYRLIAQPELRANFEGGNLAAWLVRVATNDALGFRRKYRREQTLDDATVGTAEQQPAHDGEVEAKLLVERFRRERLEPSLAPLFEARFLRQISQRDAAKELGIHRTTLVYQEQKIRVALRDFLLSDAS